jgi:hypothetical protein
MEDVMAEVGSSTAILIYQQDLDRENDAQGVKVRQTASWPRSWANFSPLWLYSRRKAWANLHLFWANLTSFSPKASVAKAKAAGANVQLQTAPTVNMLNDAAHASIIAWLVEQAGIGPSTVGDCGRGLPDNMTPLKLVECASARLANHTLFSMSKADGLVRFYRSPCTSIGSYYFVLGCITKIVQGWPNLRDLAQHFD